LFHYISVERVGTQIAVHCERNTMGYFILPSLDLSGAPDYSLTIGHLPESPSGFCRGYIDNFRISKRTFFGGNIQHSIPDFAPVASELVDVLLLNLDGSNDSVDVVDSSYVAPNTTETPTFSVAGGNFTDFVDVSLSCATSSASIYYSTDYGVSWLLYSTPFHLTASTHLMVYATYTGYNESPIVFENYFVTPAVSIGCAFDSALINARLDALSSSVNSLAANVNFLSLSSFLAFENIQTANTLASEVKSLTEESLATRNEIQSLNI